MEEEKADALFRAFTKTDQAAKFKQVLARGMCVKHAGAYSEERAHEPPHAGAPPSAPPRVQLRVCTPTHTCTHPQGLGFHTGGGGAPSGSWKAQQQGAPGTSFVRAGEAPPAAALARSAARESAEQQRQRLEAADRVAARMAALKAARCVRVRVCTTRCRRGGR